MVQMTAALGSIDTYNRLLVLLQDFWPPIWWLTTMVSSSRLTLCEVGRQASGTVGAPAAASITASCAAAVLMENADVQTLQQDVALQACAQHIVIEQLAYGTINTAQLA